MTLNRSRLGRELLRLALCALLIVSAMAGARMQGEMGALALAFGGHDAALCSGLAQPGAPEGETGNPAPDHCVLCAMPVADAPPAATALRAASAWRAPVYIDISGPTALPLDTPYAARGPPAFG